jgi:hypothetical protein
MTTAADRERRHEPAAGRAPLWLSAWCVAAAFGAYFCIYGFRKPFTAAAYTGTLWGIDYKLVLVIAQVFGYMLAKFVGIKVIAEMRPERRVAAIGVLIAMAQVSLLLFAVVPPPYNALCMLANGLPLGLVFGLVLGFLEGRRATEALAAGLCASFILADGVTKGVGTALLHAGVSEFWMPSLAGLIFAGPLLPFLWMLWRIPPPNRDDEAHRARRLPMTRDDRWAFFTRYAGGLTLLVLFFLLVTVLRSMRQDFMPEIWRGLGQTIQPQIFAQSETLIALVVVAVAGLTVVIRGNRSAFFTSLAISIGGLVLVVLAVVALRGGWLSPFAFMVLVGLGLYLPYVAVHTTIFERLIAMTRDRGNIGYLMYLADAFAYLGYVAVMLARNLWVQPTTSRPGDLAQFFVSAAWMLALAAVATLVLAWRYFAATPSAAEVELRDGKT